MKGGLNLRNDELFNKLDISPKSDVLKLIKLQKELNQNDVGKLIRESLDAIQQNLYFLESIDIDKNNLSSQSQLQSQKLTKVDNPKNRLLQSLNPNGDNFMKAISELYKLLYKLFKKELLLKGESIDKLSDSIQKILKEGILTHIKFFRIYVKHYQQGKFLSIINKFEECINTNSNSSKILEFYNKLSNFKYIFELDVYYGIIFGQSLLQIFGFNSKKNSNESSSSIEHSMISDSSNSMLMLPIITPFLDSTNSTNEIDVDTKNSANETDKNNGSSKDDKTIKLHGKILITRIKVLDNIFGLIRNIILDPTLKSLLKFNIEPNYDEISFENDKIDFETFIATMKEQNEPQQQSDRGIQESNPGSIRDKRDKKLPAIQITQDYPEDSGSSLLNTSSNIDLISLLSNILKVDKTPLSYEDLFNTYKSRVDGQKGGTLDTNNTKDISTINPVSSKKYGYPSFILPLQQDIKGGGNGKESPVSSSEKYIDELKKDINENTDNNKESIEREKIIENLKDKLENINPDDDITESITDYTKRQTNKLYSDIKEFINKPELIDNENKILDNNYSEFLNEFDPKKINTLSYKELRKALYRIQNNEYFEDIKITNQDIYTFIAATYILRVISLYIVTWFIEIEVIKDVESVILSYIMTYILLFLLTYTFVNLSDNKLNTAKGFLYYFYSRVNFDYTRFIIHLGLLSLLIIIPFIIRVNDKEPASYKQTSDIKKHYLNKFISNMSAIIWVILSIIAFFFK